jgi:hypothetical protein
MHTIIITFFYGSYMVKCGDLGIEARFDRLEEAALFAAELAKAINS